MAIRSNADVGFTLTFHYDNFPEQEHYSAQFTDQEEELANLADDATIILKENMSIRLKFFTGNPTDRLYIEGMDTVKSATFDENGEAYFSSSPEHRPFLTAFQLIPGSYPLRLTYQGRTYYSRLLLISNVMDQSVWTQLCQEVNAFLQGLAEQFILNKQEGSADEPLPESVRNFNLHHQYLFLQKSAAAFLGALDDIHKNTKFTIRETHELVAPGKAHRIDMQTIRHQQRYGNATHRLYVPQKAITYNIPANRLLKSDLMQLYPILSRLESMGHTMVAEFQQVLNEEKSFLHSRQKRKLNTIPNEQQIHDYQANLDRWREGIRMVQGLRLRLYSFFALPWFAAIRQAPLTPASTAHSLLDPRYAAIHKFVTTLSQHPFKLSLAPSYRLQFKRSNKLYEIWCFIRIHQLLMQELGFAVQDGWIYQDGMLKEHVIPLLRSGEQLSYQKDNMELHLTYDAIIPQEPEKTDFRKAPLYISYKHRRPDIRLDVYYKGYFAGSIIFDAKYRRASSVYYHREDVLEQIRDYSHAGSPFYLTGLEKIIAKPVQEVILMLPNKNTDEKISADTDGLSLLEEYPGMEQSQCLPRIQKLLKNMREFTDWCIERT